MKKNAVSKEDWVGLFKEIGLSDDQMEAWHKAFEQRYPEAHQDFLSWLGIPGPEIRQIRDWSGKK